MVPQLFDGTVYGTVLYIVYILNTVYTTKYPYTYTTKYPYTLYL